MTELSSESKPNSYFDFWKMLKYAIDNKWKVSLLIVLLGLRSCWIHWLLQSIHLFLFKMMTKVFLTFGTIKASSPKTYVSFSEREMATALCLWNAVRHLEGNVHSSICVKCLNVFVSHSFESLTLRRSEWVSLSHDSHFYWSTGSGQHGLETELRLGTADIWG